MVPTLCVVTLVRTLCVRSAGTRSVGTIKTRRTDRRPGREVKTPIRRWLWPRSTSPRLKLAQSSSS